MALLALATVAGATLQSAAGFGFALVLAPAVFAVLEPDEAVTTLLVLGAALNLLVLYSERRPRQPLGGEVTILLAWAVPGLVLGALILAALSRPALQVAVGVLVLLAAVVQARTTARRHPSPDSSTATASRAAAGLTTGVLTTTTGTSGPPLLLWFEHIGATPGQLRDSLSTTFLALNALGTAALLAPGGAALRLDAGTVAALLALTALGQLAGRAIFARLDHGRFRAVGLALVLLTGLASIAVGAAG